MSADDGPVTDLDVAAKRSAVSRVRHGLRSGHRARHGRRPEMRLSEPMEVIMPPPSVPR